MPIPSDSSSDIQVDALIIGGGIAGLWTLNALAGRGYQVLLLEKSALGGGQTIAAQGVVHGGLKYAAGGLLNDASEALATMPDRWRACLDGSGEIDLTGAQRLAPCQHLWTRGGGTSAIAGFFASKMLKSRIARLKRADYPAPLDHPAYRGHVFELGEFAVDTPGVLRELARPHAERLTKGSAHELKPTGSGIDARLDDGRTIHAKHLVLTAGAGNAACLGQLGLADELPMQRRPLHQVLVKHPDLPPFYSVCLGTGPKPPMVCTTHRHPDGQPVWYLGGDLAETGVERDSSEQISAAQKLLNELLPWVDLSDAQWATLRIDRAEAQTADRNRHPGAWVETRKNVTTVWPSKLALAPDAADQVLAQLEIAGLQPPTERTPLNLPPGDLAPAQSPWDTADFRNA